jgi:hypothetical protein
MDSRPSPFADIITSSTETYDTPHTENYYDEIIYNPPPNYYNALHLEVKEKGKMSLRESVSTLIKRNTTVFALTISIVTNLICTGIALGIVAIASILKNIKKIIHYYPKTLR